MSKCCSRCGETKEESLFIKKRNICKKCTNERSKELKKLIVVDDTTTKVCTVCDEEKVSSLFIKGRYLCIDCNNNQRRERYLTDEEHRKKKVIESSIYKAKKTKKKTRT